MSLAHSSFALHHSKITGLACAAHSVTNFSQPFVDDDHILHAFFLPRVWAIRIPVILIVLATTVVGTFLSTVMIKSNRKKALKAQQKKAS